MRAALHYMADMSEKLGEIAKMVDKGLYFTVNRARQFGKTTMLYLLGQSLAARYLVADTSFEGVGDGPFATEKGFCGMFAGVFSDALKKAGASDGLISAWQRGAPSDMRELGGQIGDFCEKSPKPVVLLIDEVDKAAGSQVFLSFLGMLRSKYLKRSKGAGRSFQSVVLAGVHDVKNLRRKISGDGLRSGAGERAYNSPWNIAADFLVDLSLSPAEISTMLADYESCRRTGMNVAEISGELHRYTSGYPFLASKLCKVIDERLGGDWSLEGVALAVKALLRDKNTLFDDMFKNIENNQRLYRLIFEVMIEGWEVPFSLAQPEIELGSMYGILRDKGGSVAIGNEIFELCISDYLAAKIAAERPVRNMVLQGDVVENGKFDMAACLEKFAGHFYELHSRNDADFLESHGRILFMTYLRPLINGQGFCHIEPQTRNTRRMDLVVDYGRQQFVVELKLWHGEKRHEDAYAQLCGYLDGKGMDEGYLLTFDFRRKGKKRKAEWVEYGGKRIFDTVV